MKMKYFQFLSLLLVLQTGLAQNVAINNTGAEPDSNAILDISSDTKGLLIPRMTTAAREAIPNTVGLMVYDTDTKSFWYNDGSAWVDLAVGKGWALGGNAGTDPAVHFIGTTDLRPLIFKVNNDQSGIIDPARENVAFGYVSLMLNSTGSDNTAIGYWAMASNTDGVSNTAIGNTALAWNTSGSGNTAVGAYALRSNSTGQRNTGLGYGSLFENTTGSGNTALGHLSLTSNTTGSNNTAVGWSALGENTIAALNTAVGWESMRFSAEGGSNTALGAQSLLRNAGTNNVGIGYSTLSSNTSGSYNTAVGTEALYFNTSGQDNAAVGYRSMLYNTTGLYNAGFGNYAFVNNVSGNGNAGVGYHAASLNTTGSDNVAVGIYALRGNETGDGNIAIGAYADVASGDLYNAIAIGSDAVVDQSNKIRLGNGAITVIEAQVPLTTPSDGRFKFNVQEDVKGLDFILKLRPVTYQFNVQQFDEGISRLTAKKDAGINELPQTRLNYNAALQQRRIGFIAQEVEEAAASAGFNFSGLTRPQSPEQHYSLSYESFVVPLVKAVQEQQEIIEELKREIKELREMIKK